MLKLVLGIAGSGKTSRILSEITENAKLGQVGQYLIVPEQYSHEAERELCAAGGDGICLYAEVLSFSRLAVRVAQEAGTGGRVSVDNAGRLLCMSLALDKVGSGLKLYSSATRKTELLSGLFAAVEELKAAQVDPKLLESAAMQAGGTLSDKLSDLLLCLEAYNAVLSQGRADPTDKLVRLAETLECSSVGAGHICIDGFTDFTGAEMLVIEALLKKGANITVCLTCDGLDGAGEQFEPSRKAAFSLLRLADKHGVAAETEASCSDSGKAAALRFFDEHLFAYTSETHCADGCISLITCDSLRDECEMACARCIELVRDTGCRWRDVAIAVRGFEDYYAPLKDIFSLYGVPLITASRESILQKNAPAAIFSAFEVIFGGWALSDVLAYMKTGLTGLGSDECDELERYAELWNIRGSYWYRAAGFTMHPDGFGALWDDAARAKLMRIDSARTRLTAPLFRLYKCGEAAKTAVQQAQALADFLEETGFARSLSERAEKLEEAGLMQLAAETGQLWEIIVRSLEQFAGIMGDTPMSQPEFAKLFSRVLSQYDVSAIPASPDSVSAGEVDRMRRRHIKHLIFLGASDDRIPAVSSAGGILSDDERDELREYGLNLGGSDDRLQREFSLIYNCVTLPGESLTISYCTSDSSGAKSRPSFLVKRASMLLGIEPDSFDIVKARLCTEDTAFLLAAQQNTLAYAYFAASEQGASKLVELEARRLGGLVALSPDSAQALYGKVKTLSPSQTETFSGCRLSYFLRYGLRLDEKKQSGFTPPELGTFMHYVLENTVRDIAAGIGFNSADEAAVFASVDKYISSYVSERLGGFEDKSPRFVYLFDRMRPAVRRVTLDTIRELGSSDFRPLDFELKFMRDGDLPPIEIAGAAARIVGIADRVDGYERDGKLYVRVVDYKTGKKAFSLSDIYNGMGMQMLIYLFALEAEGGKRYGREIVPAGVAYVPAKDITVSASADLSDEELAAKRAKALKRSGLLLHNEAILTAMEHGDSCEYLPITRDKNGELTGDSLASEQQFKALKSFVSDKLADLSDKLSCGCIEAEPYYRSETDNACRNCPYLSVCRFDDTTGKRRYLSKIKPEQFWEKLGGDCHE